MKIILLLFERGSMSECFEYPQYHHQTHEKSLGRSEKKVWESLNRNMYRFRSRRVLGEVFDFQCL